MFDNIGSKLKKVASIMFVLGAISASVWGIVVLVMGVQNESFLAGLLAGVLIAGGGILMSYLSVIALYAFGQLVENSDAIVAHLRKVERSTAAPTQVRTVCGDCGHEYMGTPAPNSPCPKCGSLHKTYPRR